MSAITHYVLYVYCIPRAPKTRAPYVLRFRAQPTNRLQNFSVHRVQSCGLKGRKGLKGRHLPSSNARARAM